MQAPGVTVVLVGTKYVTFKRRVEVFKEMMSGSGGQSDAEYSHVRRGYHWKVASQSVGRLEVTMEAGWGGCPVGDRFESPVYRGVSRMMREAGFMVEVNEAEQWVRILPQQLWKERKDDESEDGCLVTRSGRTCRYCESMSRGETESEASSDVIVKLAEAQLGEGTV